MKRTFTLLGSIITVFFALASAGAFAQSSTATPVTLAGPTSTTPIPAQASDAGKFLCAGDQIKLVPVGLDPSATKFEWYKYDPNNNAVLVQSGSGSVYTENESAAGYYKYKLVQLNSNDCASPASDPYSVYVLPALSPAIAAQSPSVCENGQTTSVLSVIGLVDGYTYTYQWYRGTTAINGPEGTANTYTVKETIDVTTPTIVTYKVVVSYALATGCNQSATKDITIVPTPAKPTIAFSTN